MNPNKIHENLEILQPDPSFSFTPPMHLLRTEPFSTFQANPNEGWQLSSLEPAGGAWQLLKQEFQFSDRPIHHRFPGRCRTWWY
jgi:hypothetical protein